jgi:Flp pilus assembly protein TadG
MVKVWRAFFAHRKHDEMGSAEFATALMVFPVLFILIIGSIEVGFYVQTRMRVENIARDAARQVAAGGGNHNERTATSHEAVDALAFKRLWTGSKCTLSQCPKAPTVNCRYIVTRAGDTAQQDKVDFAGETVTCVVTYHYKPLSGGLMTGPLGLGIGGILKSPFTVRESARAETGTLG